MRRTGIVAGLAALAAVVGFFIVRGESQSQRGQSGSPGYVHSVVFYLKKDAPKGSDAELIADSHKLLAKIPSVKGLWVGRPADKYTPKVAVTDYQVGLLVLFDNYEGLKTYLDHDLHTQYVEKHGKHIEKVLVYDYVHQAK
jgi:hypothetical protein